jgi:hypothetical protein
MIVMHRHNFTEQQEAEGQENSQLDETLYSGIDMQSASHITGLTPTNGSGGQSNPSFERILNSGLVLQRVAAGVNRLYRNSDYSKAKSQTNLSNRNYFKDLLKFGDLRDASKQEVVDNRRSRSTCDSGEIGRTRLDINGTQRASGDSGRQSGGRGTLVQPHKTSLSKEIRISEEPDPLLVA